MKKYVVAVLYYAQRNYSDKKLVQAKTVEAKSPDMAKYIVLGYIMDQEHRHENGYINIKHVEVTEVID